MIYDPAFLPIRSYYEANPRPRLQVVRDEEADAAAAARELEDLTGALILCSLDDTDGSDEVVEQRAADINDSCPDCGALPIEPCCHDPRGTW